MHWLLASWYKHLSFLKFRLKRRVGRSGPELVRYHSRGTNVNPFTPSELQKRDGPGGKTFLTSSRKVSWWGAVYSSVGRLVSVA